MRPLRFHRWLRELVQRFSSGNPFRLAYLLSCCPEKASQEVAGTSNTVTAAALEPVAVEKDTPAGWEEGPMVAVGAAAGQRGETHTLCRLEPKNTPFVEAAAVLMALKKDRQRIPALEFEKTEVLVARGAVAMESNSRGIPAGSAYYEQEGHRSPDRLHH